MEKEIKEPPKFRDFYQFTFNFAKNPGQKGLGMPHFILNELQVMYVHVSGFLFPDLDMALAYWNIVMKGRFKFLDLWCAFLQVYMSVLSVHVFYIIWCFINCRSITNGPYLATHGIYY